MYANFWFIEDINDLVDGMYMALTETAVLAKVFSVFYYGKKVVEFSKLLQDPVLFLKKQNEKDYFIVRHKTMSFLHKLYTCTALGFCCTCFADPFFRSNWKLPFDAWMPFNWRSWSTYFYAYFFEVIGMVVTCLANCTCDFFQGYLLMQISLYYKLIGFRLEIIGWDNEDPQMKLKEAIRLRMLVDR